MEESPICTFRTHRVVSTPLRILSMYTPDIHDIDI
jgi:hypothetical protein